MQHYEDSVSKFNFPITIINGSEDFKYIEIGKMVLLNNKVNQHIVLNAAHNIHIESVDKFTDLLIWRYLTNTEEQNTHAGNVIINFSILGLKSLSA